jgi:hypothetical protein
MSRIGVDRIAKLMQLEWTKFQKRQAENGPIVPAALVRSQNRRYTIKVSAT